MTLIKVAIIGCGTIAHTAHIPSYLENPNCEIKYFCDILPERAEEAVLRYCCGQAVTDYHDILKDPEVQAVSVCTPNLVHAQISIDCLRAGKNVLCEKPAARELEEAVKMQQAQRETGKILNIGMVNRFNTSVNLIKQKIDSGELGTIYHVYASFRRHRGIPGLGGDFTTKAISGGGVLIDIGVHFLDIVMYCCGDPRPLTASGKAYSVLGKNIGEYVYEDMWAGPPKPDGIYDVDDFVSGFIRTDGPTISFNGAWAQNIGIPEMYIDFLGDKAGIRLQYGGNFVVYGTRDGRLHTYTPAFESVPMFQEEIDRFIECIRTGEKLPSHIDKAIITTRIMQAIYDSSDSGKEIVIG